MIAACKKANVKLMIAYRCHFEPTNLRAVKLLRDGAIGQIQAIESTYGFNIHPGEWRLSKKMAGGGPLFDVGIYSLNACRYLTGEEPEHISAYSSVIDRDGRFNEVEENVSWTMKFPSGIVASCNTTYGGPDERLLSRARRRRVGSKQIRHSTMRDCISARSTPARRSMNQPMRAIRINSRPRRIIFRSVFRPIRNRRRRARKVCAI